MDAWRPLGAKLVQVRHDAADAAAIVRRLRAAQCTLEIADMALTLAGEHRSLRESRWGVHITNVDPRLLLALVPLVIIELALKIYSIVDLYKPERRVRGGNKLIWLLAILLVSTLGWVAYLIVGREEG